MKETRRMNVRNRLAALFAAGALVMAVGAVALAAPPSYSISVDKQANPTAVPPSGGTVVFSVVVDNTGSGHLAQVNIVDSMVGCTLGAPSGDTDADTNLDATETWTYQCTVNNVTPGMSNTATVNACHSAGTCNNSSHDAAGSDTVTLLTGSPTSPPVTDPPVTDPPVTDPPVTDPPVTDPPVTDPPVTDPPVTDPPVTDPPVTEAPTFAPSQDQGGESDVPTFQPSQDQGGESDNPDASQPETDTVLGNDATRPSDTTWMLVIALGMLLASILLASPSKAVRNR
jgi:hypothetical protein